MSRPHLVLADKSEPPSELTLYAETRAVAGDADRWARCHVAADKSPRIDLPEKRRKWGWS